jgi:hypothetical protein
VTSAQHPDRNPYSLFEVDMNRRLDPGLSARSALPGPRIPGGETVTVPV